MHSIQPHGIDSIIPSFQCQTLTKQKFEQSDIHPVYLLSFLSCFCIIYLVPDCLPKAIIAHTIKSLFEMNVPLIRPCNQSCFIFAAFELQSKNLVQPPVKCATTRRPDEAVHVQLCNAVQCENSHSSKCQVCATAQGFFPCSSRQ